MKSLKRDVVRHSLRATGLAEGGFDPEQPHAQPPISK